jgi:hypothetical protein
VAAGHGQSKKRGSGASKGMNHHRSTRILTVKPSTIARYTSYEAFFDRRSTLEELISALRNYSRESVIYVCSAAALLMRIWNRGGFDIQGHDNLVQSFFKPVMASSLIALSRLSEPQFVFHRRQFLLIIKLAIVHCAETGIDLVKEPSGFGDAFLMANDRFHFALGGVTAEEKFLNTLTDFVPVIEYSGIRLQSEIARAFLLLTEISPKLRDHPDFIDIPETFCAVTGVPLLDHFALWFGLFSKFMALDLATLQKDWMELYIRPDFYRTTQIPPETARKFLEELTASPQALKNGFLKRDYGSNDFTVLRDKPLVGETNGAIPTDMFFVLEKMQAGPYWRINNSSRRTGDKLRRFWGSVFEEYVQRLFSQSCSRKINFYKDAPQYEGNISEQVCDGLLLCGRGLILLEYKSSMFRAESKYAGQPTLLQAEIEQKLVQNEENSPKGVKQLANAVKRLFGTGQRARIRGVDLANIKYIFPVLVTLDSIGRTLMLSRFLHEYFLRELDDQLPTDPHIFPLLSLYVEDIEVLSGYLREVPFAEILHNWIEKDPKLISTILAIENPTLAALGPRTSDFMDQTFDRCYSAIIERLGLQDDGTIA